MAMSLATLEILEQAQFPPAQARALARAFEAESGTKFENLATKSDLAQLEVRLGKESSAAKTESMRWTVLVMSGQTALLAGVMYFLLQNTR